MTTDNTTIRLDLTEEEAGLILVLVGCCSGRMSADLGFGIEAPYDIYSALSGIDAWTTDQDVEIQVRK